MHPAGQVVDRILKQHFGFRVTQPLDFVDGHLQQHGPHARFAIVPLGVGIEIQHWLPTLYGVPECEQRLASTRLTGNYVELSTAKSDCLAVKAGRSKILTRQRRATNDLK